MAEAHAVRFDEALDMPEGIILDVMRCWRDAKDHGEAVQPYIYETLARHRLEILVPVFDSLMTLCEAAMKRSFVAGEDGDRSGRPGARGYRLRERPRDKHDGK